MEQDCRFGSDKLAVLLFADVPLAAEAALELARQGFRVVEMEGGFDAWQKSDFAVESGEIAAAA